MFANKQKEEAARGLVTDRSAKYFYAVLKGIWIVSYDWLKDSGETGSWLEEEPYEIQGDVKTNYAGTPKKSRTSTYV